MRDDRIRSATPDDFPAMARVESAADRMFPKGRLPPNGGTYPTGALERANKDGLLLVAMGDGEIVGFVVAEAAGANFHLYLVAVLPDWGRRGIGRSLVEAVIEGASARGSESVTLTTFEDIPWNAPFYRKLGFEIVAETECTEAVRATLEAERSQGLSNRVAMQRFLQRRSRVGDGSSTSRTTRRDERP